MTLRLGSLCSGIGALDLGRYKDYEEVGRVKIGRKVIPLLSNPPPPPGWLCELERAWAGAQSGRRVSEDPWVETDPHA